MSLAFSFEASEAEEQLLAKALYVDEGDEDKADDLNQPPATAQEYLRRVIKEAKQVEDVGVGKLTFLFPQLFNDNPNFSLVKNFITTYIIKALVMTYFSPYFGKF